jgi:hypothetical protein
MTTGRTYEELNRNMGGGKMTEETTREVKVRIQCFSVEFQGAD